MCLSGNCSVKPFILTEGKSSGKTSFQVRVGMEQKKEQKQGRDQIMQDYPTFAKSAQQM